jgi:hypothetical protein
MICVPSDRWMPTTLGTVVLGTAAPTLGSPRPFWCARTAGERALGIVGHRVCSRRDREVRDRWASKSSNSFIEWQGPVPDADHDVLSVLDPDSLEVAR